ncbi:DUF5368 family protein [Halomonas sp. XH26]|uniref:DUF5368 family protein n=1 Tax=Vreelandella alkaliphila TaxID=272774 RepID=A0AAJ2RX40_9GAMM|nr:MULTISPECIES: DUF5368 family protein [Halomonas]AIA74198.1 hypothetical protein FF32_04880 [Halomonas campaniensis]MDX5977726.1 DUF5368 family protein [Halomonas alkaliphila]UTA79688.1 DUF5368 family protein [Halomonas sp. XH26]
MTIGGILTILMYTLAPFIWLLMIGLTIIIGLLLLAYLRGYQITHHHSHLASLLAVLIGLTAFLWVPWLTHSTLGYVATVVDWIALIGAAIATFVIAFITLHPLSYLIRLQNEK